MQDQTNAQQGAAQSGSARQLADIGRQTSRELAMPDLRIDMFSLRGFELAQRIARAFATSDAVPAQFRTHNLKKVGNQEEWVENSSALGNCLVAVETAQAVGMSITAVMQNANIIEGKLSWSGKFIIAAVNASGRFTPLRFQITNKGVIKAKFKEKTGWDAQARKVIWTDREIEVENLECVAWALPAGFDFPKGVYTLMQAKEVGLPVIEGAPVSVKMAVEEGWYSKPGSKWQTEMKHLMLQYRAGAYFGNIHAPDVVMGMGRSTEELQDAMVIDVEPQPGGHYAANLDSLRGASAAPQAEVQEVTERTQPEQHEQPGADQPAAPTDRAQVEQPAEGATTAPAVDTAQAGTQSKPAPLTPQASEQYERLMGQLNRAGSLSQLADVYELVGEVANTELRAALTTLYKQRMGELTPKASQNEGPGQEDKPVAPTRRTRARSSGNAPE